MKFKTRQKFFVSRLRKAWRRFGVLARKFLRTPTVRKTLKRVGSFEVRPLVPILIATIIVGNVFKATPAFAINCPTSGTDVVITVNCDFPAGSYTFTGTLTINPGVTVTALGNTATNSGVIITSDSIRVDGTLTADNQGFPSGDGPGAGASQTGACTATGAGGHGGKGGSGNIAGGAAYDSVTQPDELGSAGGDRCNGNQAGAGGGAIKLVASSGTVIVAGTITANGQVSPDSTAAGGGAGGSIWIQAGTLTGGGTIRANGGGSGGTGPGGGGGRVSLTYTTDSSTGTRQAFGGLPSGATAERGGAGTIFTDDTDDALVNGNLLVDNNSVTLAVETPQVISPQTYDSIIIRKGSWYRIPAGQTLASTTTTGTVSFGGTPIPTLTIEGTLVMPTASFTWSGVNVTHKGEVKTMTNPTVLNGTYSLDTDTGTFPSGTAGRANDVTVGSGGYLETRSLTPLFLNALTVNSGGIVTHATNTGLAKTDHLSISATGSITVDASGSINVENKGFQSGDGPGAGESFTASCTNIGGGGHGGGGATASTAGGGTYGSVTQPSDLGSAGGDRCNGGDGGYGGGALKIVTTATVTVNGTISSDGVISPSSTAGGGGAGGSIWIQTGTLAGSGTVRARGGGSTGAGGAGGGGRIALYYTTDSSTIVKQASGGVSTSGGEGGAGTLFTDDTDDSLTNGALVIDNNNVVASAETTQVISPQTYDSISIRGGASYRIPSGQTLVSATTTGTITGGGTVLNTVTVDGTLQTPTASFTWNGINLFHNGEVKTMTNPTVLNGTYSLNTATAIFSSGTAGRVNNVTVGSGGRLESASSTPLYLNTLTVSAGGIVTHATNSSTVQYKLDISASSTVTVNPGGSVDVQGKGFAANRGPGAGSITAANCGFGGSYGGLGGLHTCSGGSIGVAYGSVSQPTDLGSGGSYNNSTAGGGAIKIFSPSTITIDGVITATGATTTAAFSAAGSGGSVWLDAPTITTASAGAITATGGGRTSGCSGGGAGGGGRIALTGWTTLSSGITRTAYGGTNACVGTKTFGAAGTVYTKASAAANGDLLIDDNNLANDNTTTQVSGASETYDNITIRNGSDYVIPNTSSLTLAAAGVLTGGGTSKPSLTINNGGTFNPGAATFNFNTIDVTNIGAISTVTSLTMTSAAYVGSGTGTLSATVTSLTLSNGSFTNGSSTPGLNLTGLTMTASTFTNNSTGLNLTGITMTNSTLTNNAANAGLNFATLTIPSGSTINDNSSAYYSLGSGLTSLTVSGTYSRGSLNTLFLNDLTVTGTGIVTHATNSATVQYKLAISATSTVTINAGGTVNVKGKGFSQDNGPGVGSRTGANCGYGGSYGGLGGLHTCTGGAIGVTYGSVSQPIDLGSGGSYDNASNGGGAIKIFSAGTVTINGTINADGATHTPAFSSPGSGGSIWIDAPTITTASVGTITAAGGNRTSGCSGGGAGGGGRIALTGWTTLSSSITRTAYGGTNACVGTKTFGGAGTVYTKASGATNGDLVVDNNNLANENTTNQVGGSSETYDNITIKNGTDYTIPNTSSLALASGGTLTGGGTSRPSLTINNGATFNTGAASFNFTSIDVANSGSVATVTGLTLTGSTLTMSGTGTFPAGVTSLTLSNATVNQGSQNPALNLTT
jgi:hypothetical protein